MTLVAAVPEPAEYRLDLAVQPPPTAGRPVDLKFDVFDPWNDRPVTKFGIVHERLFHAFIVSRDLEFFRHDHPQWQGGSFHDAVTLPRPGMYRILADFYPEAATPQLLNATIFVAGDEAPASPLTADSSPKEAENLRVEFSASPKTPVAGSPTRLRFTLSPALGLERLLGAWGHMLIASDDLIDMMHEHPSLADGAPEMEFSVVFPRARMYRVWVQFQRAGVVNTAHFDIRVQPQDGGRS